MSVQTHIVETIDQVAFLGCGAGTAAWAVFLMSTSKLRVNIWAAPSHRSVYDSFKADGCIRSIGIYNSTAYPTFCDELEAAVAGAAYIITPESSLPTPSHSAPGWRATMQIGGHPISADTKDVVGSLFPPCLEWCSDALEVALLGKNDIVHAGSALLSSALIGKMSPGVLMYRDIIGSEASLNLIADLEREKEAVVRAYGYTFEGFTSWINRTYACNFADIADWAHGSETHNMHPFLPSSLEHRYIASDVARGLQFFVELAQVAGVEVPNFKAVVTLAGAVTRTNHAVTGTTLASFGLGPRQSDAERYSRPLHGRRNQEVRLQSRSIRSPRILAASIPNYDIVLRLPVVNVSMFVW
ncbi:NAD/NADP octopine/nopaline dehydrogenase [Roridomyces roridus]|uniref:NAD/NADP octopine/nopaline dehydrogenase n=1 Tax=Roridomyces roridus TaxID=1738132 RepID=A0AAD7B6L3_9AGAR|nr:NAD/NADP octopine/nopaline dehydrogenase [Roridomyces roridus]